MTIAVTGSSGFIGGHLVAELEKAGSETFAIPRDLLYQPEKLSEALHAKKVKSMVHLAWSVARTARQDDEQAECVRLNEVVLEAAGRAGVARVLSLGTADEFGSRGGVLRPEDAAAGTLSAYGIGKSKAREAGRAWASGGNRSFLWLRPFSVYGPGQQGTMAIPYAIACARNRKDAEFSDALQQRDFIIVSDVVSAVVCALKSKLTGFHVFNVGTGTGVSLRDVLELIASHFGATECFHFGRKARRPGEPDLLIADIADTTRLLGWSPRIAWRDGIELTCRHAAG